MPVPDISDLGFSQLKELRDACNSRMKDMREVGSEELRRKLIEDAAALGLAPEEVFQLPKKRRRRRRSKPEDSEDATYE